MTILQTIWTWLAQPDPMPDPKPDTTHTADEKRRIMHRIAADLCAEDHNAAIVGQKGSTIARYRVAIGDHQLTVHTIARLRVTLSQIASHHPGHFVGCSLQGDEITVQVIAPLPPPPPEPPPVPFPFLRIDTEAKKTQSN